MRRRVFDKIVSYTGLLLAAVLLVAGGLLTWASTYVERGPHDVYSEEEEDFQHEYALGHLLLNGITTALPIRYPECETGRIWIAES